MSRYFRTLLTAAAAVAGVVMWSPSVASISDGLIAYWNFDDCTAEDASGHGNNGTIQGPLCVDGVKGKALSFQGTVSGASGDHVLLPSIDFAALGEFSICLYVNEQAMEHPHGESYINWGWGSWAQWVVIGHFPDTSGVGESVWMTTGQYPPIEVPFNAATEQNRPVHYCLVHDSSGVTAAYKDFVLVDEQAEPVIVGGYPGDGCAGKTLVDRGSVTRFTGIIDEVRVYDRALTEGEVADLEVYAFSGFYTPVDNPPELNGAKAGRAIPLKWRVTDLQGDPVDDLESVSVVAIGLACAAGETPDQMEESAAGNSGLQNLGDGYYQWNWKTPKSYSSSCKLLRLDLGDGIKHEALFQFK